MKVFSVFLILRTCTCATFENHQKLEEYLISKMNKNIRPLTDQSQTLNVTFLPILTAIQSLNEKTQVLSCTLGFTLMWISDTMTWNPSDFNNTSGFRISPKDMWIPEFMIHNAVGDTFELRTSNFMKPAISSNGIINWNTGGNTETSCKVDISRYPFDTQTCHIIIGKSSSLDYELMMIPAAAKISTLLYDENENGEWELLDASVDYHAINEHVTFLKCTLVLKRRPLFYILNILLPVILLSLMNVLSFKLSINCGERMSYSVALFLTFIVLLNIVTDEMPKVSKTVSFLQLYINTQLAIGMFITTISVFLVHSTHSKTNGVVTGAVLAVYKFCNLCSKKQQVRSKSPEEDDQHEDEHIKNGQCEKLDMEHVQQTPGRSNAESNQSPPIVDAVNVIDDTLFWTFLIVAPPNSSAEMISPVAAWTRGGPPRKMVPMRFIITASSAMRLMPHIHTCDDPGSGHISILHCMPCNGRQLQKIIIVVQQQ
ncbi:ACHA6-like protein, partial [Mya arenaria]